MTIFLDFDGVLHPLWEPAPFNDWDLERIFGPRRYAGPFFLHAATLAALLAPHLPSLDIVISSTWAKARDLEVLRAFLPAELALRVSDAVHHHLPPQDHGDAGAGLATRWAEIAFYREHVRPDIGSRWIAIDDDDSGWPVAQRSHLLHCTRDLGDKAVRQMLEEAVRSRVMLLSG